VAGGKGHAVFNGKIFVQKGAQKIDAYQLNRSLLLSDKAKVDAKPQLEIFADDVRCTHGATIGQLDDEQVFYLKSRGYDEQAARGMLTYAFAGEVLDEIDVPSLRQRLIEIARSRTR
jgi:Fe-S cluster assembly protein SufD